MTNSADHAGSETPPVCDDCQIYVLLGRELLEWRRKPPDISQFAVFYRPEGSGWAEQCPWAQLGITPLPHGEPDMDNMRYFTAPKYRDGGMTADVHFITKRVARDSRGRALPPYVNQVNLTLTKHDGRWTLAAREQGPMT